MKYSCRSGEWERRANMGRMGS
ncbi:MAG: hypothetical protein ACXABY_31650 [Candidatus Thorarchaeota archaeon]